MNKAYLVVACLCIGTLGTAVAETPADRNLGVGDDTQAADVDNLQLNAVEKAVECVSQKKSLYECEEINDFLQSDLPGLTASLDSGKAYEEAYLKALNGSAALKEGRHWLKILAQGPWWFEGDAVITSLPRGGLKHTEISQKAPFTVQ